MQFVRYFAAMVWLINGLLFKVAEIVPRHEAIVARILGPEFSGPLTILIGIGETLIAIWILTGRQRKLCAVVQAGLVMSMNVIEFFFARDLLIFGSANILLATVFSTAVIVNEYRSNR